MDNQRAKKGLKERVEMCVQSGNEAEIRDYGHKWMSGWRMLLGERKFFVSEG